MKPARIVETLFDPKTALSYEGLFTIGSGYLHVRGSLEEHLGDAPQNTPYMRMPGNVSAEKFGGTCAKWGTYVPGIFGKHPLLNREMVNLPWFLDLAPVIAGERLDMRISGIRDYRRELDLRTATLSRVVTWLPRNGPPVNVHFELFISAARPNLCVQRLTLKAERRTAMELIAGIDGDVLTSGYDHLSHVAVKHAGKNGLACDTVTDTGEKVRIVSRLSPAHASWTFSEGKRSGRLAAKFNAKAGVEIVIEKRTAVTTSRDLVKQSAESILNDAAALSFEQLHSEHAALWTERWAAADVEIEGDDESQGEMNAAIYHLLRCHVPDDARVAVDAKGYAGDAYYGRFFWDTEMYILPFYIYTDPKRAKTLVDFRVRTLAGAKANAKEYGYRGARYAWESDEQGRESCCAWQYRDHELHVTADVVYGFAHFATGAGSPAYLEGPAARVMVETARFWLDRMDVRDGGKQPNLLGVMGPDEYKPICDNNAYTNSMVKFALSLAAQYGKEGGASSSEIKSFLAAAKNLPVPRAQNGKLVLQCEGFDRLADPRFAQLWKDRSVCYYNAVGQERVYRSKALKQADVLMMMMLFPGEFTDAEVRLAWDYYLRYTTHDSSLSPGVHAIMACRLGKPADAWRFWKMASGLDVDVVHGGPAQGIHIANSGAAWMIAMFGFAGMETAMWTDTLTLDPKLPAKWKRLAFPVIWKGCPAHVDIRRDRIAVTNCGSRDLSVKICGRTRTVAPGAIIEEKIRNARKTRS